MRCNEVDHNQSHLSELLYFLHSKERTKKGRTVQKETDKDPSKNVTFEIS